MYDESVDASVDGEGNNEGTARTEDARRAGDATGGHLSVSEEGSRVSLTLLLGHNMRELLLQ